MTAPPEARACPVKTFKYNMMQAVRVRLGKPKPGGGNSEKQGVSLTLRSTPAVRLGNCRRVCIRLKVRFSERMRNSKSCPILLRKNTYQFSQGFDPIKSFRTSRCPVGRTARTAWRARERRRIGSG